MNHLDRIEEGIDEIIEAEDRNSGIKIYTNKRVARSTTDDDCESWTLNNRRRS